MGFFPKLKLLSRYSYQNNWATYAANEEYD